MHINHITKVSTFKLKHSTPQIGIIIVQVFCGYVRAGSLKVPYTLLNYKGLNHVRIPQ
jgi:hypothetical protein